MGIHWGYFFLFNAVISFIFFCVMNVVTSTFCQTVIENASNDMDQIIHNHISTKDAHMNRMKCLFANLGDNGTGLISYDELAEFLENTEVQAYFQTLNLGVSEVHTLFTLLDTHHRDCVDLEEFMEGCIRLRGSAKSVDMTKLMHENKLIMTEICHLQQALKSIDDRFN